METITQLWFGLVQSREGHVGLYASESVVHLPSKVRRPLRQDRQGGVGGLGREGNRCSRRRLSTTKKSMFRAILLLRG